jgi:hypothetical protein
MSQAEKAKKRAINVGLESSSLAKLKKEWRVELTKRERVSEFFNARGKCRSLDQNMDIVCGIRLAQKVGLIGPLHVFAN